MASGKVGGHRRAVQKSLYAIEQARADMARHRRCWKALQGGLDPVEQVFARIKHWMRLAQRRSLEDLWHKLGDLVVAFKPPECAS